MDKPKLIGSVRLPIPKIIRKDHAEGWAEMAGSVAYDTEGRAWYLVGRLERIRVEGERPGSLRSSLRRLTLVRWQLCGDLPFDFTPPAGPLEDGEPSPTDTE